LCIRRWRRRRRRRRRRRISHSYAETKLVKSIEVGSRILDAKDWREGELLVKGCTFQLCKVSES
jgi:hypothetical protein